ncbi:type II toxin-antitoxin system VapC family toxin [Endozoicomonas ascidiicola]|uniref:type II toxin-antitoxin system VapC family toxin n=1 Tax=Endozoicomonas ascidiicola TaxID=1698521 RepID=UPI0008333AFC|nr:PIN domain nuclease [Endozoicomonas ascidiicola]
MDIMVDTSVWVDFFNGVENQYVHYLEKSLQEGRVATCPVILMEVLQGIRSDKACQKTKIFLSSLASYSISDQLYIDSALLYRAARKKGLTIRKSVDCLIAVTAIHHALPLLHKDRDFDAIEKYSKLICVNANQH